MEPARFSLVNYRFDKAQIDLDGISPEASFNISFDPTGIFNQKDSSYQLQFEFSAVDDMTKRAVIFVRCQAIYLVPGAKTIEDIPAFFYNNAIAILFPYVRAFVSTLTLQANVKPFILPTMNLSALQEELKKHTSVL